MDLREFYEVSGGPALARRLWFRAGGVRRACTGRAAPAAPRCGWGSRVRQLLIAGWVSRPPCCCARAPLHMRYGTPWPAARRRPQKAGELLPGKKGISIVEADWGTIKGALAAAAAAARARDLAYCAQLSGRRARGRGVRLWAGAGGGVAQAGGGGRRRIQGLQGAHFAGAGRAIACARATLAPQA